MSASTDYIQLTHAASEIDETIDEVYAARGSYGNLSGRIASKQDALTEEQLDAVNSGITAAKLTADEAALVELVDSGAKNHCTMESGSNPSSDRWINIPVSDVGVGQWVMSFGTLTSTDTDDTLCQAICFNSSNKQVSNWVNFKREANTNKVFTITDNATYVRLYSANSYATSAGDTVTFTNAMICTAADWAASQKFVPYCPSLQDLVMQKATDVVNGTTTLSGTGVSVTLKGGNIYRLTASAKYKAVNLSEIAIKYTISGTIYSVCSNSITPASNVVYLTTTGLITPSSDITVETYVKTETNGNVEILLLAEKIYARS